MYLRTATTLTLALGFMITTADQVEARRGQQGNSNQDALTEAEAAALAFMREEEKLARDVYQVMYDLWGTQIFANIAASEQTHMDRIKDLLDTYGLSDPALGPGEFSDPSLQALYDNLVLRGSVSLLEALQVGGMIEEVDIEDLEHAIAETTHADIQTVYSNLMAGSVNHINAFVGQIEGLGVEYVAQFLSQEEVDALLVDTDSRRTRKGGRR